MSMIVVGKFGAVHGVKGYIRVHSFTDPKENIVEYLPWQVQTTKNKAWSPIDISHTQWQGDQLVVQIRGINDRDEAKRYTNLTIGVDRDQLPVIDSEEEAFYWSDLIGLQVVDQNKAILGTVDGYFETGANDVMVVKGEQEHLIPYIDDVIQTVDLVAKTITVNWEEPQD